MHRDETRINHVNKLSSIKNIVNNYFLKNKGLTFGSFSNGMNFLNGKVVL